MQCIIAGTGYTGARLLTAIDGSVSVSRQPLPTIGASPCYVRDLDQTSVEPVALDDRYAMICCIPPAVEEANETRLERLLHALHPPLQRIVYLSTTGVYGDQQGRLTDEATPPAPSNARARRRLTDEKTLLNYDNEHDCEIVILRVPGIYGPGRLGIDRIQSGTTFIDEADAYPGNRIHVDDLVQCCIAAIQTNVPAGVYNVGDGDHRSSTAFATLVTDLAGLKPPQTISRKEANATFSELRLSFLRESRTLDTTKMREVLGVEPRYGDVEDGIRASLIDDGILIG